MQNENLIPVALYCKHYKVEVSFIQTLQQYGFIHTVSDEAEEFIDADDLHTIEKLMRMHYELDINIQGIEAINFLLERVQNMQHEINYLKSKLNIYENE
ncbi:MAG: chaperone modulator CbpM [Parafilimonas sp.]